MKCARFLDFGFEIMMKIASKPGIAGVAVSKPSNAIQPDFV